MARRGVQTGGAEGGSNEPPEPLLDPQGLEVMILGDFRHVKRDICFKMSEVRLSKDLKKSSNQVSEK